MKAHNLPFTYLPLFSLSFYYKNLVIYSSDLDAVEIMCRSVYIEFFFFLTQMSFDPNLLHNNGHNGYPNGTSAALRETGVIEKLLTSYGFIQCSERQARLFFHCSQYNGNLQDLKVGGNLLIVLFFFKKKKLITNFSYIATCS